MIQVLGGPLLQLLQLKEKQNQQTIERLVKEKEELEQQLLTVKQTKGRSLQREDSLL